ncbi:MAG TPA: hypothetical protein VGP36_23795 [Mycobacteriales bacterium]|nr:hypothetical protein [Mycobacteriales bacterium]
MNADEILARTFADHEGDAPDPDAVLADVHARLARRRRTAPVLAAAATVAAIAIGASVLVDQHRPDPAPPASTPSPSATPSATQIALGTTWLPPGTVRTTLLQRSYGTETRLYTVSVPHQPQISVQLQVRPGTELTPPGGSPPLAEFGYRQRDLTIAGRPAREWANDAGHRDSSYQLVVRLPDQRIAEIEVFVDFTREGRGAMLATIGRRVAASLQLDRPEPVGTAFRPTHVPSGFVVSAVGRGDLDGTTWILTTPGAVPDGAAVTIRQSPRAFRTGDVPGTVADGRAVRGRPTHVITDGATVTLYVDLLRPGTSVQLTSTHAAVTLAELYRIADGIRF